jgi:hypothetical protein
MRALLAAALLACTSLAATHAALAGMGPCKPDAQNGLTCGAGVGAARIIDNTTSPDGKVAFAWRDPDGDPTVEPDKDELDLLLVRLSDGAVLAKSKTEVWSTGQSRRSRRDEDVAWSPDSSLALHAFQTRFKTERLELFGLDKEAATSVDLLKTVEPAVRAKLAKNAGSRVFSIRGDLTIDVSNAAKVHFIVQMWRPKDGPEDYYDVTLNVTHGKSGLKAGAPAVRKIKAPN